MSNNVSDKISIYLSVDAQTLNGYFNAHDPSPLYKRQLSHELQQYITSSVSTAKRASAVFYKVKCGNELDKQYAEPLLYAIRTHYTARKERREKEFKRFKIRSWSLLAVSLLVVAFCQGFVPMFFDEGNRLHTSFINSLDIFSWVLLWRPIDVLLFYWNPHLKDILLLHKLSTAEAIIIEHGR